MKKASQVLEEQSQSMYKEDWSTTLAYGDKDTNEVVESAMEQYADQFRIIERLIERGIWVEISPITIKDWACNIYKADDGKANGFVQLYGFAGFDTYHTALADAVGYLRPLGYLEWLV